MANHTARSIDEMQTAFGGAMKLAAAELEIESFGMQVFDFPPNSDGHPEHDHAEGRQEEVYVPLVGSGEIEVDGERVALEPGMMVRVGPAGRRKIHPGADGIRVLVVGRPVQGDYERPEMFRGAPA